MVASEKSTVIASQPSIVVALANEVVSGIVKPAFHAKLLGADSVGGSKRCTVQHQTRPAVFRDKKRAFHSLRGAGANVQQMLVAVGPHAILYSVETVGLSDTALHNTRASFATTAAAKASGKNIEFTLYVMDGPSGTSEPAFDSYVNPAKFWALAVWESWFSTSELDETLQLARKRINNCKGSMWSVVAATHKARCVGHGTATNASRSQ